MPDDSSNSNSTVLVAIVAVAGIAAAWIISRPASASTGSTDRDEIVDQLRESLNETTSNAPEGTGPSFTEQVVSRTGFLPSGFDAAGRISLINQGEQVGL